MLAAGWFDSQITSDGNGGLTAVKLIAQSLTNNLTAVSVNGTTAGSCSLYQFLLGTIKATFVYFNGYENTTATEQKLTLPQAYTASRISFWANGGVPVSHFYSSGTQLTGKVVYVNGFPTGAGAGSISSGQNAINGFMYGEVQAAWDTFGCGVSQSQTFTASCFFLGT